MPNGRKIARRGSLGESILTRVVCGLRMQNEPKPAPLLEVLKIENRKLVIFY
jgi:hypothetical protein